MEKQLNILKENNDLLKLKEGIITGSVALSNESVSGMIESVSVFFKKRMNNVSTLFTKNGSRKSKNGETKKQLLRDIDVCKKLIKKIDKQNIEFQSIQGKEAPIMTGAALNIPDTASVLKEAFSIIDKNLEDAIEDLDKTLSRALSSEDFKNKSRSSITPHEIHESREKLDILLSKMINPDSVDDRKPIREIIPGLNHTSRINDMMKELIQDSELDFMVDLKNRYTPTISEKIDILMEEMEKGELPISQAAINEVTSKIEVTANLVTTSVSIQHVMIQTLDSFRNTLDIIEKYGKSK